MNESFQIVFENTGNRALINDIAIDDVALMQNGDCPLYFTTESAIDETDGIFNIQSCVNRCNETSPMRMLDDNDRITIDLLLREVFERCDCHMDCGDLGTCCPDFNSICLDGE